jgi:hypothetical protein
MRLPLPLILFFLPSFLYGQSKYDYHWTIGYDTSLLDPGGDVVLLDFNINPVKVKTEKTVERFVSFGAASTMSDATGKLIFYTSGCYIVNAAHEIMANGDSINPGIIQQYDCPFGSSNNPGGAMAIPWPDSPNLYLLFVNDYEAIDFPGDPGTGSARHLHYNVIDMTKDGGLGAVIVKNQVLVEDSLSVNSIEACRHENGRDWWIITPKARSNCYFITLVTPEGVGLPQKICTGIPFDENTITGQSCFTPDGRKFIRFNKINGLHLYDFDTATGLLSNEQWHLLDDLPSHTVGVSVSPNSRYLYISSVSVLYQYDLLAPDLMASRVLLAVPDNVPDPFVPSVFTYSALAPDGKIYISSGSTHLSLHIIHRPDCPGLFSLPERRGLPLTSWNYLNVPNLPHFRNEPSNSPCDSMIVQTYTPVDGDKDIVVFPNPTTEGVNIFVNHPLPEKASWILYDQLGAVVRQIDISTLVEDYSVDLEGLTSGFYFYAVVMEGQKIQQGKLLVFH